MVKILSIDDSRAVHAFLNQILAETGYEIVHAYNGTEGIQIACGVEKFDLILLDWEMPGLTGPEVFIELRKKGVPTPVIMLTSKNEVHEIGEMLEKGASEYVMKPFTQEILIEKINTILGI
jgi:two-component system chemotaxis response regulator CheY